MATQYTWQFPALDCYPQEAGETDVVYTIHYVLNGTDGTYNGSVYGTVGVTYTAGEPYTPFNELTEAQVQGWTEEALGEETVTAMYANIDGQIENQINPKSISLPPPWIPVPEVVEEPAA